MHDGLLGDPPPVGFALKPPALSEANPASLEFLRAWVSGEQVAVELRGDLWRDPAAWGVALVDVAVAAARSYERKGLPLQVALERIREGLDAEWEVASTGPDRAPVPLSAKAQPLPSARARAKPVRRRAPRGSR
ncbi:MAG: DUF5076 domain-containing protein [Myxococcaceae bacterium]